MLKSILEDLGFKAGDVVIRLTPVSCCFCGTVFGVEANLHTHLLKSGHTFYCPNGHSIWYGESESDKLKKELAQQAQALEMQETRLRQEREWRKQEHEQREAAERRLRATRGVVTRTKNRIANGVCPCCNRTFSNLHRHMQTQHPDYRFEEPAI